MSRSSEMVHLDDPVSGGESQILISGDELSHMYNSVSVKEETWQIPLSDFLAKKQGPRIQQFKSKRLRSFYHAQDDLIDAYNDVSGAHKDDDVNASSLAEQNLRVIRYSQITFALNFILTSAKLTASIMSGSMSIISSLIDSVVDLLSGIILWWAAREIRHRDIYVYPQGRNRLEPVSIVILSVVMSLASLEMIRESLMKIGNLVQDPSNLPSVHLVVFIIAGTTVVVKLILWLVCRRVDSSMIQALAMDHRNDVLSNAVAIVCGYLEFQKQVHLQGFIFVDPAGAILISFYIIANWCILASEQITFLTGLTAQPHFLSKVTWMAVNHHRRITHVDTVRAFHIGVRLHVDVDIVISKDTVLHVTHDIGETLQQKLERLPEVDRAYVHVDYETVHSPHVEHKPL